MHVLLTGASGVLGSEFLTSLSTQPCQLSAIARTPARVPAQPHLNVLQGDLMLPGLGRDDLAHVFKDVTHCVHMAANVKWNLGEADAVAANTSATQQLLMLLKRYAPRLEQFIFVSTAFVDELSCTKGESGVLRRAQFNNSYEYSKHLAEEAVKASGLAWSILRPSIIIGRSSDGHVAGFNGLYQLLKVFVSGLLPFVTGSPKARVDVVPVDQVVAALQAMLGNASALGRTFYASSGAQAPSLQTIIDYVMRRTNSFREADGLAALKPLPIIPLSVYERFYKPMLCQGLSTKQQRYRELLDYFLPYLLIDQPRLLTAEENLANTTALAAALERCIDYWCACHRSLLQKQAYQWKAPALA